MMGWRWGRILSPGYGTFLTQDPIGLAGGVNLYAYAGNNPISFSDPFGLTVCFQGAQKEGCNDPDAKRLWDKTYAQGNDSLRNAMDGMVLSKYTYGLRFGTPSRDLILGQPGAFAQREFGETSKSRDFDGGVIVVDVSDINHHLSFADARMTLAHEIGHVYIPGTGEGVENEVIQKFENPFRKGLSWPARGEYSARQPKLPAPGGTRFP